VFSLNRPIPSLITVLTRDELFLVIYHGDKDTGGMSQSLSKRVKHQKKTQKISAVLLKYLEFATETRSWAEFDEKLLVK